MVWLKLTERRKAPCNWWLPPHWRLDDTKGAIFLWQPEYPGTFLVTFRKTTAFNESHADHLARQWYLQSVEKHHVRGDFRLTERNNILIYKGHRVCLYVIKLFKNYRAYCHQIGKIRRGGFYRWISRFNGSAGFPEISYKEIKLS